MGLPSHSDPFPAGSAGIWGHRWVPQVCVLSTGRGRKEGAQRHAPQRLWSISGPSLPTFLPRHPPHTHLWGCSVHHTWVAGANLGLRGMEQVQKGTDGEG